MNLGVPPLRIKNLTMARPTMRASGAATQEIPCGIAAGSPREAGSKPPAEYSIPQHHVASCDIVHRDATRNMQHATCNIQHTTFTALTIHCALCTVRHALYHIQHNTYGMHHATQHNAMQGNAMR